MAPPGAVRRKHSQPINRRGENTCPLRFIVRRCEPHRRPRRTCQHVESAAIRVVWIPAAAAVSRHRQLPFPSIQPQGQATSHAHARQSGTGNWLLPSKKASLLPRRQRDREVLAPLHLAHLPGTLALPGRPLNQPRAGAILLLSSRFLYSSQEPNITFTPPQ